MTEIEITVPLQTDLSQAEQIIEQCCKAEGLSASLKVSLAKYPGCIHWHFKRDGQRGTLEITLCASMRRIWFSIHTGRTGDWIEETLTCLKQDLSSPLTFDTIPTTTHCNSSPNRHPQI